MTTGCTWSPFTKPSNKSQTKEILKAGSLPAPLTCQAGEVANFFLVGGTFAHSFRNKTPEEMKNPNFCGNTPFPFCDPSDTRTRNEEELIEAHFTNLPDRTTKDIFLSARPAEITNVYKFEYCITEEAKVRLERVLHGNPDGTIQLIPVTSQAKQIGFEELVFGDGSKIDLEIPTEGNEILKVVSWRGSDSSNSKSPRVMIGQGSKESDGRVNLKSKPVQVDETITGVDPFGKCHTIGSRGVFNSQIISMGTAKLSLDICIFANSDDTWDYEAVNLVIEDSSVELSDSDKRPKEFKKAQLKRVWKETLTHHSTCDNFVLELPHATYAATAAPGFRADPVEDTCKEQKHPKAPKINEDTNKGLWQISYKNGKKANGEFTSNNYIDEKSASNALNGSNPK